jgi:hypothetical protein
VAFCYMDRIVLVIPDVPPAPVEFRVPNAIHKCVTGVEAIDRIAAPL